MRENTHLPEMFGHQDSKMFIGTGTDEVFGGGQKRRNGGRGGGGRGGRGGRNNAG